MADLETIRKKLEKYIIENNHTFREISLKIGRKDSYIQQYIKYGFPKRLNEMDRKRICQLLNIPEKELLDDELLRNALTPSPYEDEDIRSSNNEFISLDIYAPRPHADIYQNIIGRMSLNFIEFGHWLSGNPFDFAAAVLHYIGCNRLAVYLISPMFTKINSANQFPHDQEVNAV